MVFSYLLLCGWLASSFGLDNTNAPDHRLENDMGATAMEDVLQTFIQHPKIDAPSKERRLSTSFCEDDGTVDFSDEESFNQIALKSDFSPMCSCVERDNSEKVLEFLEKWLKNGPPLSIVGDRVNDVLGTISGEKSYECINACEFCFPSTDTNVTQKCGMYESTYKYLYQVEDSTAILKQVQEGKTEKLVAGGGGQYMHSEFFFDYCFLHTVGAEGRVCYGTNPRGMTETKEALDECFVSHNSKLCSSCKKSNDCFQANCTNVKGGAMIDSCDASTTTGSFEILAWYQARTDDLTRGACGDIEKMADHPTPAPKIERGVGYTDTIVRVERVSSGETGNIGSVWVIIGVSSLLLFLSL